MKMECAMVIRFGKGNFDRDESGGGGYGFLIQERNPESNFLFVMVSMKMVERFCLYEWPPNLT